MTTTNYVTDDAEGYGWRAMLGDSCRRLAEIDTDSVDLTVSSPPFADLFTYSPSVYDLGNRKTRAQFLEQYRIVIAETLRATKPGRVACIHVQQLATRKGRDGYIGLTDFRGDVIQAHIDEGWIFAGEVTVWKNPQAQQIRAKVMALSFTQMERDSSMTRPALGDYLLIFRAPGDNAEPIVQGDGHPTRVTRDEWIEWASPIYEAGEALGSAAWWDIRETDVLNTAVAREDADERHICPLQLDFIERCVRLWSNPGDLVLDPFGGIGSTGVVAVQFGRRSVSCELKPSYWHTACRNLADAVEQAAVVSLFDEGEAS